MADNYFSSSRWSTDFGRNIELMYHITMIPEFIFNQYVYMIKRMYKNKEIFKITFQHSSQKLTEHRRRKKINGKTDEEGFRQKVIYFSFFIPSDQFLSCSVQ